MLMQLQIFKPTCLPVLILQGDPSDLPHITDDTLSPSSLPDGSVLSDGLRAALVTSCRAIHANISSRTSGYCWIHHDDSEFCCVIWLRNDDISTLAHECMHILYYLHDNDLIDGSESEAYFLQSLLQGWQGREWCTQKPRDIPISKN